MINVRIDSTYSMVIKDIYENSTIHVKIDEDIKIDFIILEIGVGQSDVISPKLFTEDVFKKLDWENIGIKIDGKYSSHLRFADKAILISSDLAQQKSML